MIVRYYGHDHEYEDAGVVCGNCAETLCYKEIEDGCFECNHRPTDNTCLNYGDGHCKWCHECQFAPASASA